MSLRKDLTEKNFIITVELNPPKASNYKNLIENARKVSGLASAINVTDNSGANSKMCPLAACHLIQSQTEIDTIWQVTCRDRNRLALESDLYGASALGLQNILPLRGDPPQGSLSAEKCFDLNTEELIQLIESLKNSEKEKLDFCIGSAAHPGTPDLNSVKETMLRRLDQGVEFFQTQICYEADIIKRFVDAIGEEIASKTILGLTPLKTLKQADFMNKNVWGVTVPDTHIEALNKALADQNPDSEKGKELMQVEGLRLAKELVNLIKTTPLKGIHIMAIGQEDKLDQIIKALC